jgi:hypothetical protein
LVGYKSHATNTHRDCAVRIPLTPTFAFAIILTG